MSKIPKYAAKRDANEKGIVQALRGIGASVYHVSAKGKLDLEVGFRGANYKLEVKTLKGKLTPDEQDFIDNWNGQCAVVRDIDQALRVIGAIDG